MKYGYKRFLILIYDPGLPFNREYLQIFSHVQLIFGFKKNLCTCSLFCSNDDFHWML